MGINIGAYRRPLVFDPYESRNSLPITEWDYLRYSGDEDFAISGIKKIYDKDDEGWRPADLNEAREWVKENIEYEGNHKRWFDMFDLMQEDESIYLHNGW